MSKKLSKISLGILLISLSFILSFCGTPKNEKTNTMHNNNSSETNNKQTLTAPIVLKSFVNKIGQTGTQKEYYLQASIQDYYIKFCESNISRDELEKHLNTINGLIKAVTLEVEYRDGLWDICNEKEPMQSRTGEYVVIHKIIK